MNGISETVVLTKLDIYVFIRHTLTIMHKIGGSSCRDRMVVGFTTIYAIIPYQH